MDQNGNNKGYIMNSELKEKGFIILKDFIPKSLCNFSKLYFKMKADAMDYTIDPQCPLSKSFYGDYFTETLLISSIPSLSEVTGLKLLPQYSYTRIYSYGEELVRHRDRASCEFTATVCLGKPEGEDINPIYIQNKMDESNPHRADLEEGDLCIFTGTVLDHWRPPLENSWLLQTFIHYTDLNGEYGNRIWDGRYGPGFSSKAK